MQSKGLGILPFHRLTTPILVGLMLLHAALALAFAWEAPWRTAGISNGRYLPDISAPDEIAHANYVGELLRTGRLPTLDPATAGPAQTYEHHQPPLFYLLDAAVARTVGVDSVEEQKAAFPLRAVNALIGASTVAGTFFLALSACHSRKIALAASAVVTLLPMNAAISGAVSNDPLLISLCTWTLALAIRASRRESLWDAALVGLLAGLAVLTKFTALLLVPVLPILLRRGRSIAVAAVVGSVLALPLLLRNVQAYGHPLAASAFNATFHRDVDLAALRTPYGFAHWAYVLLAGTGLSFVGEFGYMDIHLPNSVCLPLVAILLVSVVAGIRFAELDRRVRMGLWTFGLLLLASYVSYNLWQVQPQARYLFPALGPLALAAILGSVKLGRRAPIAVAALLIGLAVADGVALAILPHAFETRAARALQKSQGTLGPVSRP
jgi:4-amino-4-deoxy-L-arabinose transferase-like glycosyltransferase